MSRRTPPSYRARLALAVGSLRSRVTWECWDIAQARQWRNRMVRADVWETNHGAGLCADYRLRLAAYLPCVHG